MATSKKAPMTNAAKYLNVALGQSRSAIASPIEMAAVSRTPAMANAIIAVIVALFAARIPASAQAIRFDSTTYTTNGSCVSGKQCPVLAIPGATMRLCTPPGCASQATTYTDASAGTPCPLNAQVTITGGANPTSCVSSSNAQGEFGFWALPGSYNYYLTLPNGGATYGPYPLSIHGDSGGYVYDANYQTLVAACTAAGAGTLAITKTWPLQVTETLNCNLWFLANGLIQSANGETVFVNGTVTAPEGQQIADTHLGGNLVLMKNPRLSANWYGILPNNTDATAAFGAMLRASQIAGGGTIHFPASVAGNLYSLGCTTLPNNTVNPPTQVPWIFEGDGALQNHPSGVPVYPTARGGSVINNTCTSSTSALFDTRGNGTLEIRGLSVVNTSGSDVSFAIHTTNTTLNVHDNVFAGRVQPLSASTNPAQDQISLGDANETISGSFAAPFQGYLTKIWKNEFMYSRRGVWCRAFCNGTVIDSNDFTYGNGGIAAIDLYGGPSTPAVGNVVRDNIIEIANGGYQNYTYGIRGFSAFSSMIEGNGCYDANPTQAGVCIYLVTGGGNQPPNYVISNLCGADGLFLCYKDDNANTIWVPGTKGPLAVGSGHDIGVNGTASDDLTFTFFKDLAAQASLYYTHNDGAVNIYSWVNSRILMKVLPSGAGTFYGPRIINDSPSGDSYIGLARAGTDRWYVYNDAGGNNFRVVDAVAGTVPLSIAPTTGVATFAAYGGSGNRGMCTDNSGILFACKLPMVSASVVTTAVGSDDYTISGVTSASKCNFSPTDATAATNIATAYILTKGTNLVTLAHASTAGMHFDIVCTQ